MSSMKTQQYQDYSHDIQSMKAHIKQMEQQYKMKQTMKAEWEKKTQDQKQKKEKNDKEMYAMK